MKVVIFLLFFIAAVNTRFSCRDSLRSYSLVRSESEPFTVADCFLPIQGKVCYRLYGSCDAWTWDVKDSDCVKEVVGIGCRPSKNSFKSYEECALTARPVCNGIN
uniref:Uncharacterized protein LOC114330919 n=1 Tax=Diabrotica virgifera virgifera TaxID=50390 RepID=A0A6P7FJ96_DIAVI